MSRMYKLETYVPEAAVERVKTAIFAAGAGRLGNYDCCCWQTSGHGQFRPLAGSSPAVGQQGRIEVVAEVKLEAVCAPEALPAVIAALKSAHPYETPAFQYWAVEG